MHPSLFSFCTLTCPLSSPCTARSIAQDSGSLLSSSRLDSDDSDYPSELSTPLSTDRPVFKRPSFVPPLPLELVHPAPIDEQDDDDEDGDGDGSSQPAADSTGQHEAEDDEVAAGGYPEYAGSDYDYGGRGDTSGTHHEDSSAYMSHSDEQSSDKQYIEMMRAKIRADIHSGGRAQDSASSQSDRDTVRTKGSQSGSPKSDKAVMRGRKDSGTKEKRKKDVAEQRSGDRRCEDSSSHRGRADGPGSAGSGGDGGWCEAVSHSERAGQAESEPNSHRDGDSSRTHDLPALPHQQQEQEQDEQEASSERAAMQGD